MSGSVTPARRGRSEVDEEEDDYDTPTNSDTQPANANKRARLSNGRNRNHEAGGPDSEVYMSIDTLTHLKSTDFL